MYGYWWFNNNNNNNNKYIIELSQVSLADFFALFIVKYFFNMQERRPHTKEKFKVYYNRINLRWISKFVLLCACVSRYVLLSHVQITVLSNLNLSNALLSFIIDIRKSCTMRCNPPYEITWVCYRIIRSWMLILLYLNFYSYHMI